MKSFTTYQLAGKQFPQKLPPWKLTAVKGFSTLAKFALPLVLQSIYKNMENQKCLQNDQQCREGESLWVILVKITISLSLCYFLDILCDYTMQEYQLNLKKQLTKRIVENSILIYTNSKQKQVFHIAQNGTSDPKHQDLSNKEFAEASKDKLSIWTSISSKMPVYVYNYHNSLLSLVFESLNIFGVCVYLYMKLSYSLIFGLIIALMIMKKILLVTQQMQGMFFDNIQLKERKLKLLKHFFNHLVEYKMTWLDKWIWNKIAQTEQQYQKNIKKVKYLDVWCVSLWRFTSISISSVVVISFYYLGIEATQTITPSTLIQFLMILTMPLNGLSWNIAGLRNSLRAIQELQSTVTALNIQNQNQEESVASRISDEKNKSRAIKFGKDADFAIKFEKQAKQAKYVFDEEFQINEGHFVSVQGKKQAENFMNVLPFLLKNILCYDIEIGYVEQNSWQIENILQSLSFKQKKRFEKQPQNSPSLPELMQIFDCHEIPQFSTITSKKLSGGEKMRINLVRAFLNCKIVVINSDLTCVDVKMRQKFARGFNYLIKKYQVTIFCRTIQVTRQNHLNNVGYLKFKLKNGKDFKKKGQDSTRTYVSYAKREEAFTFEQIGLEKAENMVVSKQIEIKLQTSLRKQRQNILQQEDSEDPSRSELVSSKQNSLDSLKWQTFTTYYKSKYHIVFLVGITCATICEHYYQFYMNNYVKIQSIHGGTGLTAHDVHVIIILTVMYAGFLFIRAFYFAVADAEESRRLSKQLDQNIVMNQIEFYENFKESNQIQSDDSKNIKNDTQNIQPQQSEQFVSLLEGEPANGSEQGSEKGNGSIGSKLIYHGTTDICDISDGYSWKANILFNNIFTTLSSIMIIFSEIPLIGVVLIPIVLFTIYMNNSYQSESQRLLKVQKRVEQNLLKTFHEIEEGIKYIYLYGKLQLFKAQVYHSVDKQINIQWKLGNLKRTLNARYKSMMILFLVIIILSFGYVGLYPSNHEPSSLSVAPSNNLFDIHLNSVHGKCALETESFSDAEFNDSRNKSGKFAMLINYTITLANFMLFFTVSLAQTATKALSIQRIRPLLSQENSIKSSKRLSDLQQVLTKIKTSLSAPISLNSSHPLISITNLQFSYQNNQKGDHKSIVFDGLNLELKLHEKILIRGKSGNGKTTLYKLLCSLYKNILNTINYPFHVSFSPQHPLILPQTQTVLQNLDPYSLFSPNKTMKKQEESQKNQIEDCLKRYIIAELKKSDSFLSEQKKQVFELLEKPLDAMTYKEKIMVNNLRAWLYGRNGVKIYDEPFWVGVSSDETYILTTHQRQFKHDKVLFLENKQLLSK